MPSYLAFAVYLAGFVPLLIVAGYTDFDAVRTTVSGQYSALERLYTEPRVVWSYIAQSLAPDIRQMSLFHDDWEISYSLVSPSTTLIALLSLVALTAFGFWSRIRLPVVSFAILWFVSGHVLESSSLGLELYYEHRNYLPTLGPVFGATYYLLHPGYRYRAFRRGVFATLLIVFTSLTTQLSLIWSNHVRLTAYWAFHHPSSYRSQVVLAGTLSENNNPLAIDAAREAISLRPDLLDPYLRQAIISCRHNNYAAPDEAKRQLMESAESGQTTSEFVLLLHGLTEEVLDHRCRFLDSDELLKYLRVLRTNPHILASPGALAFVWEAEAMVFARADPPRPDKVEEALASSVALRPKLQTLLWYAKIAAAQNRFSTAYDRLRLIQEYVDRRVIQRWISGRKIAELKATISEWERAADSTP